MEELGGGVPPLLTPTPASGSVARRREREAGRERERERLGEKETSGGGAAGFELRPAVLVNKRGRGREEIWGR